MESVFVDVTDNVERGPNWSKVLIARFSAEEWERRSALERAHGGPNVPTLTGAGWTRGHLLVMDIGTGQGGLFHPTAQDDFNTLDGLRVTMLFKRFLDWLPGQDLSDLTTIPAIVELPETPDP